MQALSEPKTRKFIHKRVLLKEKMARLARLRHRRDKNTFFAQVKDLDLPLKYGPLQKKLYQHILGMTISENEDGLDHALFGYVRNSVTVENDKNKLICVKLNKNHQQEINEIDDETLNEWEMRYGQQWSTWARDYKNMKQSYRNFMEKHKDKFEANKLDEDTLNQQKAYAAKRDSLMAKRSCLELRFRFDDKGSSASELILNSSFVNKLNYEFEEFIQRTLVEGIPQFSPIEKRGQERPPSGLTMDIERFFDNTMALGIKLPDAIFISKNRNYKKVELSIMIGGYFIKNAAELSFIFAINDSETLLKGEALTRPVHRLYLEQQMTYEAEKKYFVEKYYREYMAQFMIKPKLVCQIRALNTKIEEEVSEDNTESTKIEDLVVKVNGESLDIAIKQE